MCNCVLNLFCVLVNMLKATSEFSTLKRVVAISTDVLYSTILNNFSRANRSVCSSSSLLSYTACGGVLNDKTVYKNFINVNHGKCNLFHTQRRSFSLQSSLDSVLQTYARWFQLLSESTVVEYAQNSIIMIHDLSGLPWWASIMLTTVLMRSLVTLPLSLYQVRNQCTYKLMPFTFSAQNKYQTKKL